jgi:hypothetical protein
MHERLALASPASNPKSKLQNPKWVPGKPVATLFKSPAATTDAPM